MLYATDRKKIKTNSFLKETDITWATIILRIIDSYKIDSKTFRIMEGYLRMVGFELKSMFYLLI